MNLSFSKVIVLSFLTICLFAACEVCTTCTFYDDADDQAIYTTEESCGSTQDIDFFELTQLERADTIDSINVTVTCIRE